ncbi:MAG TPA: hypothetical protein VHP83_17215, partial [Aggregatilineaceae bacterium]|nr:hypothetical protein [Aggregatilineaceae bacterium]
LQSQIEIEPDSGSIKRLFANMTAAGLIHLETVLLIRSSKVALVRLTDQGKNVLISAGITRVVKSDWDQLIDRGLSGQDISMTLEFLYHARVRGWKADLVEKINRQSPDVIVRLPGDVEGWNVYMVTEAYPRLSSRYDFSRPMGICTTNSSRRNALVAALRPVLVVGAATDLQTLIRTQRKGIKSELWMEKWGLP